MALGFAVALAAGGSGLPSCATDVAASWPSSKVVIAAALRGAMVVVVMSCPTGHCMANVIALMTMVVLY
ncbi:hypothetical protein D8674_030608 [Pyrus ussuriensis x Pyrus communis]|uniref:Uncharacterized protein n=1 Tax=Pyrus ussuriensis x Pyrus communis TaxID=2448454 RepID=A0A5N5EW13_9ROSA|nr:hypothetical protein D8674_030608 [Pyrus ussuriensis x Pyrus communis]